MPIRVCLCFDHAMLRTGLKARHGAVAVVDDGVDDAPALAAADDGVDDAPVLAAADVGLALGVRGAAIAAEAADVVLTDDLSRVAEALAIRRRALAAARQGIWIGWARALC
jgi:cation transport ATPase